jgi:hypothetical protein
VREFSTNDSRSSTSIDASKPVISIKTLFPFKEEDDDDDDEEEEEDDPNDET